MILWFGHNNVSLLICILINSSLYWTITNSAFVSSGAWLSMNSFLSCATERILNHKLLWQPQLSTLQQIRSCDPILEQYMKKKTTTKKTHIQLLLLSHILLLLSASSLSSLEHCRLGTRCGYLWPRIAPQCCNWPHNDANAQKEERHRSGDWCNALAEDGRSSS